MKKAGEWLIVALLGIGCATAPSEAGAQVKVYGADPSALSKSPESLEGCRFLEKTQPILEEESDRSWNDPYRKQRDAAGALGGNTMLVFSDLILARPAIDCSPRDQSPECLNYSQTWYRTSFGYYACSPEAAARLEAEARAATLPGPIFSWVIRKRTPAAPAGASGAAEPTPPTAAAAPVPPPPPAPAVDTSRSSPAPTAPPAAVTPARVVSASAQLKEQVLSMMRAGVGVDVIAAWVSSQPARPALSVDDVIDWKKSGIDEKVIQAALTR